MNLGQTLSNEKNSFKEFLFKTRENKIILLIIGVSLILQFSIFKYFYPFPSFIHGDSFVYLHTAYENLDINTYMVGYSRFLRLFSVFTSSDTALVAFQYLFIHSAALCLLYTYLYFFRVQILIKYILFAFIVFNPLLLHLANLVSSDCIFAALSLYWFACLLWIIYRPSQSIIIIQGILLFLAFTFRYNALIYPLISTIAFALSSLSLFKKFVGVAFGTSLCLLFVLYTGNKYKKLTGQWQYSPFSGWQMANNAMYAFRYVDSAQRKPVPPKFRALDNMIRTYFDTTRNILKHRQEMLIASTLYMWHPESSLYKYRNLQFKRDSNASELKKWASMGPLYYDYGAYIIKNYPFHFARYFIWPNANRYFAMPVEFLDVYNSGKDSVNIVAKLWFGYKSPKISPRYKSSKKITILNFYTIFTGVMNTVFICCILCFLVLNGFKSKNSFNKGVLLAIAIWFINAAFTIFSSAAALRFQTFPIFITTIYCLILLDWLIQLTKQYKSEKSNYNIQDINEINQQPAI